MEHYTNEFFPNSDNKNCAQKIPQCTKNVGKHYFDLERLREKKQKSQFILCDQCYQYGGYTSFCYCENKL